MSIPNEYGALRAFLDPLTPLTCQEGVYLEKLSAKRLEQHQAEALHSALSQLLIPLVEAELARLKRNASVPHERLAAADL